MQSVSSPAHSQLKLRCDIVELRSGLCEGLGTAAYVVQARALLLGGGGDGLGVRARFLGDSTDILDVADDILHIVRRVINCLADLLDVGAHIIEALLDGGKALFRFDGDFLACLDFLLGVRDCACRELSII